jgi:outer membrane immunogenic protein
MRKQIAAAMFAGLTMLAGGAALADGMPRGSVKDVPVAVPTWSGFYLGAGLGYGHLIAKNRYSENDDGVPFSSSYDGEGARGGFGTVVLGFDRQIRDRYVIGLFTEFDWSSIELKYQDTDTPQQTFRHDNTYSLGGRAGFLMTPTSLLYLTGGYSWSRGKSNGYFDIEADDIDGTIFPGVRKLTLQGPFVGIGMETQLGRNLSLRGEMRYTMYDDKVVNSFNGQFFGNLAFSDRFEADLLTGRIALTYKFNRDRDECCAGPAK